MFKSVGFCLLLATSSMAQLPTSCTPPSTPADSTYGLCAYPLNQAAAGNTQAVRDYLTNHAGCKTISGDGAGVITGLRCGGPGPEVITAGVPGWAIDSSFNPKACPPGSKCP
ncbi:hypothetical protein BDV29DRAFT_160762 [Aspergillus leporis]|uniref:Secreted protein n=1 Tax=Aspergillus leporis TaxID=41062 RepID=A0A5N5WPD0_9EURO|nr:hypothetical protein BDV29DRAFT_160762 [Aspergillus leporis]